MQRVHLIAIGGSAMHNLALALHEKGYQVSGSDDEINEPSRSRLQQAGLLPPHTGWFPGKITTDIAAVILGMHAREDNPELIRARELKLKIYSYPEYVYEATRDKIRIVIGGSHGKTTITAMILHILKAQGIETDFLVGAQLEGFSTMVGLSASSRYAVIEGDEYLASPIDRRPKFHLYKPHIAVLSGIAWDHINVFPTFENYVEQFRKFIQLIEPQGCLIYSDTDEVLTALCSERPNPGIKYMPYGIPGHHIENGVTIVHHHGKETPLKVFGDHNLMNLNAAWLVCRELGIGDAQFLQAIQSFKGASKRLELVYTGSAFTMFKDFAHSPSKLKATTAAVRKQFPSKKMVACMELHTFSSLNEDFLSQYHGTMDGADEAAVYFNPHTIAHKKLKEITPGMVLNAFGRKDLRVFTSSEAVRAFLQQQELKNSVVLMMSSGNFDGIDFKQLAEELDHREIKS
jgi:UDP-N-acetylmuramate: L-alanyl-gamma-D-glutamyl-meso-diaminopimelate ligase